MIETDADADATRSRAPDVATAPTTPLAGAMAAIELGETFVDDPERYTIAGQIGVGGMGTVLAATGARLGRTVALKVVTADREDLRVRFEREAQVTARLQHPAIVPVYGSGQGRAGQPFYAMKQVTGEPLDRVIGKTTTLATRIALLPNVIAVTEAIAYAHAQQVIHRDLKPANILVGAFGETVVIDWGLAKELAQPDDADARGKVMGTPAYMPLEQARGEPVDARADVYALGAILYHVLAGAPPFRRSGEASVPWETMLARVLSEAPPPLRELQPDAPPDLIAIVDKAMARDAAARYPSAGELADDLKKFQTGQLVGAHTYSTAQLIRRWLKRHRTAVTVAAIAVAVLAAVGVLSVTRIVREQQRTEDQRVRAVASRGEAEDLMGFMLVNLKEKLKPVGKLDLLDDVAKKATSYYQSKGDDLDDGDLVKRVIALRNVGEVLFAQGHATSALVEFHAALGLGAALAVTSPWDLERTRGLSLDHDEIGEVLQAQGKTDAAMVQYRDALAVVQALLAIDGANPGWQRDAEVSHNHVGDILLAQGSADGALAEYQAALAIAESLAAKSPGDQDAQRNRVISYEAIGDVLSETGDIAGALAKYRAGLAVAEAMAAADPANTVLQGDVSISHNLVGNMLVEHGDAAGAEAEYRAGLAITEVLAAKDPTNVQRQRDVATSHGKIGEALVARKDKAGALVELRIALGELRAIAAADPTNAKRQGDLAIIEERVGNLLRASGDLAGALALFRDELAITSSLAERDPTNAERQRNLSVTHTKIGNILRDQKDLAGALAEYRQSLAISEAAAAKHPNAADRRNLAVSHFKVATVLAAQGDNAGAYREFQPFLEFQTAQVAKDPTAENRGDLAEILEDVGDTLAGQGDKAGATAKYQAALDVVSALAAADPKNVDLPKQAATLAAKMRK